MTAPALSVTTPNGRHYENPLTRVRVPSITTIKDKKNIEGLKYWAAREAGSYVAGNLSKLAMVKDGEVAPRLSPDEIVSLVKGAPFARTSAKAEASEIGDMVHHWVDQQIKGQPVRPDVIAAAPLTARRMHAAFGAFQAKYSPQWIDSEFTVWSDKHGYAGTGDWIAKIGGSVVLGDTKTGKAVYDDTAMQLAALANADYILDADGSQRPLPQFTRFAVLHLRPTFAQLVPFDNDGITAAFQAFLACKVLFDFDVRHKGIIQLYAPKISATGKEAA